MYKIKYNNFEVEVDSAIEAKNFLDAVSAKSLNPSVKSSHPEKSVKSEMKKLVVAHKRVSKPVLWHMEEVQYIIDNIVKDGPKALMSSNTLRERHTKGAIQQMIWKVKYNPKYARMNPEIQALIDQYHKDNKPKGMFSKLTS